MNTLQTILLLLTVGVAGVSSLPGPLRLASTFSRISNELDHTTLGKCSLSSAVLPLNGTAIKLPRPTTALNLKYIALGRGTQNYTCENSTSSAIPVSVGAAATLFDASCIAAKSLTLLHEMPAVFGETPTGSLAFLAELLSHTTNSSDLIIGEHYFNAAGYPVLDLRLSGSQDWVVATKNASVDAPQISSSTCQNVAWLELDRKPGNCSGNGIEKVYRVNTYQGSAPSTCAGLNKTIEVQYAAEYWFYG
ncbi:uncharacterized protein N7484_004481 [Penicillium longicatenatum]|uniref:uncharacterized protein n=1 Tax=Penicillium longicatenatum TaxID=1561947 RepID=UPI002546BBB0|nr:uncharacterized protein N7484_004481 [Penicillium longicatenatum]KAJ5650758.1 hypothetical protein N7484_004481 [Penicillium longicatenatum]